MRKTKSVGAHSRYYYEVEGETVYAGQEGPGPAGGGAHACSLEEFISGTGNASSVMKSFIISEFGQSALERVTKHVRKKLGKA